MCHSSKVAFMNKKVQKVKLAHLIPQKRSFSIFHMYMTDTDQSHAIRKQKNKKMINKINGNCNWFILIFKRDYILMNPILSNITANREQFELFDKNV